MLSEEGLSFSQYAIQQRCDDGQTITWVINRDTGQQDQICRILKKYWYLLMDDPVVSKFLSMASQIMFKWASSLKDSLVQSFYQGNKRGDLCTVRCTITSGGCAHCQFIDTNRQVILPDNCLFRSRLSVNDKTVSSICFAMNVAHFILAKLYNSSNYATMCMQCG